MIDFFTGGGKKANALQQVEIMPMSINMTGKYTGLIQTLYDYNTITFRTPGSNVSGAPDSEYPYYNEVMGIFNLLRTPHLQVRHYTMSQQTIYLKMASDIQYVVNPASGLEVQQIQAAIVGNSIGGLNGNSLGSEAFYEGSNATYGTQYRTKYKDIGCLPRTPFILTRPSTGSINTYQWRLKVVVNLKRKDATASTQNVLFVATYPITTDIVQYSSPQDPAFIAFIETLSSCGGLPPAVSASAVTTFCNSSTYKTPQRKFLRYYQNLQKMEEEERRQQDDVINMLLNPQENELTVYPNPATDYATLQYQVPVKSAVRITLQGVILNRADVLIEDDQHQLGYFEKRIDISSLAKGVYFCTLTIDGKMTTRKLIVR